MAEIEHGGSAFPTDRSMFEAGLYPDPGMSLRDYFAAAALPALIARHRADVTWSKIAPRAFELADAMIAARGVK